jgi:tetratricopeptide (TPR) repeat protein
MTNRIASTIIDLNNNALTHFLSGDYDRAIAMLRVAFATFSTNLQPQPGATMRWVESDGSFQSSTSSSFNFTQESRGHPQHEDELPIMMDCDVDSIVKKEKALRYLRAEPTCSFASSPNTAYSMYNRALVLSEDQDDCALLVTYQHRTSAIILYNLALVHHNIGVHLGVSAALPHALKLYEMAMETVDRGGADNFVDVQKLLFALLNNMGNIHTHLFHFEHTEHCLNSLRVVLAAASAQSSVMDDDYVFFFLNALFQGKELCFAPAA